MQHGDAPKSPATRSGFFLPRNDMGHALPFLSRNR